MVSRGLSVFTHNIMDGRKLDVLLDMYRKNLPPLLQERGLGVACLQVKTNQTSG